MKVLSIGSLGRRKQISHFRQEQGESLTENDVVVDYFNITQSGFSGYVRAFLSLRNTIRKNPYALLHAHYGLSGMISVLQREIPVVVTFHGSDIWNPAVRLISLVVSYLSDWNIFVSKRLQARATGFRKYKSSVIPCGVDKKLFFPLERAKARERMGLDQDGTYVLFSSSFDNENKNYELARQALRGFPHCRVIELKGFERKEVNLLMNASDLLLVTSFQESGPLVVKEAVFCNLPVVSTDVGDVREVVSGVAGCYIATDDPKDVAEKIGLALGGRRQDKVGPKNWDMDVIAEKITLVYDAVMEKRKK